MEIKIGNRAIGPNHPTLTPAFSRLAHACGWVSGCAASVCQLGCNALLAPRSWDWLWLTMLPLAPADGTADQPVLLLTRRQAA